MAERRQSIVNTSQDKNQVRRERDRARRNSLTAEKKEEINARRRAAWQKKTQYEKNKRQRPNLTTEEKLKDNIRHRMSMQNKSEEGREKLLARRKATKAATKNTPCPQSIAMSCPNATNLTKIASTSTPEYTIRTEGNTLIFKPFIYLIMILTRTTMW